MGWSHVLREQEGQQTVEVEATVGRYVATLKMRSDPMMLGVEWLHKFAQKRDGFKRLFTPESAFALASMLPSKDDWGSVYTAWLEATGLTDEKFLYLDLALNNFDDLEADLLRVYGVDVADWLTGLMSTRRVAVLVMDLARRPETLLGAQSMGIVHPMTRGEIMLAVSVAASDGHPHASLKTHAERDEQLRTQEKMARIQARDRV